jgi:hypothetical protein
VNPLLEMTSDPADPIPLVELKQHLVLFVPDPPGPTSARAVYDLYLRYCGDVFRKYRSTFDTAYLRDWNPASRADFENRLLPQLRTRTDWGYGFSDDQPRDSWLYMFHGFRPFQQPDHASFHRFEFNWDVEPALLRGLAEYLMQQTPFLSGYGGFFLQGRPGPPYGRESYNRIFALARRYWGCEAVDVELTAAQMKKGYKCVNWLTLIGEPFRSRFPGQIAKAKAAAYDSMETHTGVLLQAAQRPLLGDRNRLADLGGYVAIAEALLPLQIKQHEGFGGDRWTDQSTLEWLRRFTRVRGVI